MKRNKNQLIEMASKLCMAMAFLLIYGALTSCSDSQDGEEKMGEKTFLNLTFSTSSATSTRANEVGKDEIPANPSTESDIHSIRVWVFKSDTGAEGLPIAYKEEKDLEANGSYKLSMQLISKINGKAIDNIDLYILANAESIDLDAAVGGKAMGSLTRADLQKAAFSNAFGIKNNASQNTSVPAEGLPISRAITHISVADHVSDTEAGAAVNPIRIPLIRAISKLHFFFARKTDGSTNHVEISRIVLDENIIPTASYIFPDEEKYNEALANQNATRTYAADTKYEAAKINFGSVGNSDIQAVAEPKDYIRGKEEQAKAYMDRLAAANITSQHLSYLRETNKAITGTIYYRLSQNGEEKSASFSIPASGNAIRNRELAVYGYFEKGEMTKLFIMPTIVDWQDGGTHNFVDKGQTDVEIPDKDQTDYGYKVAYGNPKFGPMITLKDIDTNGKTWILQTNNPMFGFVVCDEDGNYPEDENVYDPDITKEEGNHVIGHTYKIEDFLKNTTGEKTTIRFYVVPKKRLDTSVPHNIKASVFITKNPNDKFLINIDKKFPGTATELYFEQVL